MNKLWDRKTLGERFIEVAERNRNKIAIIYEDSRLTYGELLYKVEVCKELIIQKGIVSHEIVLLQMSNSIDFVCTFFALMIEKIVPVMMLPNHGSKDLKNIQRKIHCRYHITDTGIIKLNESCKIPYINDNNFNIQTMDEHIALLLLSGGTTGVPKLIPRTHGDYYYSCFMTAKRHNWNSNTILLTPLPFSHNFALAHPGILGALLMAGKVVIMKHASPLDMIELIEMEGVTSIILVPTLLHLFLKARELMPDADIHTLSQIFVGGAMLPVADAKKTIETFGNVLIQVFGTAEGLICTTKQNDPIEKKITTQGTPISSYDEIKIVDENGKEVAIGEYGELITRGPYTIRQYYGIEDKDNQYFTSQGWYRTGDYVSIDEQGYITVGGRIKEQINRAGEKIIPSYLENILAESGMFSEVAVIGIPDEFLLERICICAKPLNQKDKMTLGIIRSYLKRYGVSDFCFGDEYLEVMNWPITAVGKTDKKRLIELAKEQNNEK